MPETSDLKHRDQLAKSDHDPHRQTRSLVEWWHEIGDHALPLFNVNLAFIVISLPLVTILPALGGLYAAMLKMDRDGGAHWGTVWAGFKQHGWLSIKWGLLVTVGYGVLGVNIWLFHNSAQVWGGVALVIAVSATLLWGIINQFSLPILLLQGDKNVLLAIRTGFLIATRRPLAALGITLISLLIMLFSILLPPLLIFISVAVITYIQTQWVLNSITMIKAADHRRATPKAHRSRKDLP
jgi:uncharacterized membrane protein YesL